jgi:gliding motility-associated-like protein
MNYEYTWSSTTNTDLPKYPAMPFPITLYPPKTEEDRFRLVVASEEKNGCYTTHDIVIKPAILLKIPNAFTPNGDYSNDNWTFRNIEQYTEIFNVHVQVFNRGGMLIFENKAYNNSVGVAWNGQRNQNAMPIGTYWYVVRIVPKSTTKGTTRILQGTVTIIR